MGLREIPRTLYLLSVRGKARPPLTAILTCQVGVTGSKLYGAKTAVANFCRSADGDAEGLREDLERIKLPVFWGSIQHPSQVLRDTGPVSPLGLVVAVNKYSLNIRSKPFSDRRGWPPPLWARESVFWPLPR